MLWGMVSGEDNMPVLDTTVTITNLMTGESLIADVYRNGAYDAELEDMQYGYSIGDEIEIRATSGDSTASKIIIVKQKGFGERVDIHFGNGEILSRDNSDNIFSDNMLQADNDIIEPMSERDFRTNSPPPRYPENPNTIYIDSGESIDYTLEPEIKLTDIRCPPYFRLAFTEKENNIRMTISNDGHERKIIIVDLYHIEPDGETESFLKTIHFGTILPGQTKTKDAYDKNDDMWTPTQTDRNWIRGEIYIKGSGNERILVNEFKESFNVVPGWRPVTYIDGDWVVTTPTFIENQTIVVDGSLVVNARLEIRNTDVIAADLPVSDEYIIGEGGKHDMECTADGLYKVEVFPPNGILTILGKLWNFDENNHYWFYMNGTLNLDGIYGGWNGTVENVMGSPNPSQPGGIICTTDNVTIENGAEVRNGKTHGVWLQGSDAVISGAKIHDNGGDGIMVVDGSAPSIEGNTVEWNGRYGINAVNSTPTIRNNNTIQFNGMGGINVNNVSNSTAVIDHNIVKCNMVSGINTDNTNITISNNTISSNGMKVIFSDDMESGVGGWTYDGLWHRVNSSAVAAPPWYISRSGDWSWWYGNDATGNYDNGTRNFGNLTSPAITIPSLGAYGKSVLTFWSWYDTESDINYDQRSVTIYNQTSDYNRTVQLYRDANNTWVRQYIDISDFTGYDVQLHFNFDTIDEESNDYQGWYIDDVEIVGSYPGVVGYGINCMNNAAPLIENNSVELSWCGIYSDSSSPNITKGNYIASNEYGIYLYKSSPGLGQSNRIANVGIMSTPPGPGYWPINITNTIFENHYGIYVNQSAVNISGNNIQLQLDLSSATGAGISVVDSVSTRIYGNRMKSNMMSIYAFNSSVEIEWNLFWGIGMQAEAYDLPYGGVEGVNSSLHIFNNSVNGLGFGSTFITLLNCNETTIIENNTISPNTGQYGWGVKVAMDLTDSSPVIKNNVIDGKASSPESGVYGIKCYNNSNPRIENNTVCDLVNIGIYIDNSSPTLINNTIYGNENGGIQIENLSSPVIDSNTIYDNINYGINSTNSASTIVNNTIYSNPYGICLTSSSNGDVKNCTIFNSNLYDFYLDTDSHATALNTIFNHTKVNFTDTLSTLTVQWFLDVRVVYENSVPVSNASVIVKDILGSECANRTTAVDGWTRWIRATEYVQNQTTRVNHTAHNISALDGPLIGWAMPEPFINRSMEIIVVLGIGEGYNISLQQGWNLISLPLVPYDMSSENVLNVLKSITGKWDVVKWYNTTDYMDPWKTYRPSMPPELNDLNHLNQTISFWIYITEPDVTFIVFGNNPTTTNINLYAGWNLAGYPTFCENKTVAEAFWGTSADHVEVFDAASPTLTTEVGPTYLMKPGEGYWVHVPADTVWTVDW